MPISNEKFLQACEQGAIALRAVTPIDAQRLIETTRSELISSSNERAVVHIVQGGERRYGIRKQQGIELEVGYGKYVIMRNNYIRKNRQAIVTAIVNSICRKE